VLIDGPACLDSSNFYNTLRIFHSPSPVTLHLGQYALPESVAGCALFSVETTGFSIERHRIQRVSMWHFFKNAWCFSSGMPPFI
jgi:hypothetical protein